MRHLSGEVLWSICAWFRSQSWRSSYNSSIDGRRTVCDDVVCFRAEYRKTPRDGPRRQPHLLELGNSSLERRNLFANGPSYTFQAVRGRCGMFTSGGVSRN